MCGGGDSAAIGENIRALFQRKQVVEFAVQSINVHRSEASIADSAIAFTVPSKRAAAAGTERVLGERETTKPRRQARRI